MKLATLRTSTGTKAARLDGDEYVLLEHADVGALLASGRDWSRRASAAHGKRVSVQDVDLAALLPHPNKIICLGLNYATHIKEMGRDTPEYPTLFAKYDGALIGPYDPVVLPRVSDCVDWEAELGVVIGRPARHVPKSRALDFVGGYTVVNDVTVRDWQRRTREFLSGKTFEHTTPVGPVLVTADEFGAAEPDLELSCSVDGQQMQCSRTSDLLFGVADIVSYVSDIITLLPGDLIATGTPGGVGDGRDPKLYLQPGQQLVTTIEGIGELRNVCIAESSPNGSTDPRAPYNL
ncbi:fumarylacetoacetate hydrolase family protein [Dactylosporangium sp. NPDC049525]|uniref:fumarylacetoacetate hydrolase family protein n=1 Tax=Dactylosporangium sp. NPDC049525 TaxID=3154730 RepID=UPI0034385B89